MLGEKYLNTLDRLTAQNRLFALVLLALLFVISAMGLVMLRMQTHAQIVVMPIGSEDGLQVGNGRASERYLRRMARYVVMQIGSYTAATARDQLFELLDLFPPESVGPVQSHFERLAAEIERYPSISSAVRWSGEHPLRYDAHTIQVQVKKARLVNGSETEAKTVHYCLNYRIEETRFWLTHLVEKEDSSETACFNDATTATTATADLAG